MSLRKSYLILFLLIVLCVIDLSMLIRKNSKVSFEKYYGIVDEQVVVAFEDNYVFDQPAVYVGDMFYLDIEFVKKKIDKKIFCDGENIIIDLENKIIRLKLNCDKYLINNIEYVSYAPKEIFNKIYLPEIVLEKIYDLKISYKEKYNLLIIDKNKNDLARIKSKSKLKYDCDDNYVMDWINKNEIVNIFYDEGKFTRVRTQDGLIGYVLSKKLELEKKSDEENLKEIVENDKVKIKMAWKQVNSLSDNKLDDIAKEINIISPTWFSFDKNKANGEIISLASKNYVDHVHAHGCKIWALLSDNFNSKLNHEIIGDVNKHKFVIKKIIDLVNEFDLDGINLDLESVKSEDAKCFLIFIKELANMLKKNNKILSVDLFVLSEWNDCYDYAEIARAVDYICLMAYDEFNYMSESSGPVASYGFVMSGLKKTLKKVDNRKIILGVPFYARVWREENNKLEIKNYAMNYAFELFKNNNAKFKWLERERYLYGEYEKLEENQKVIYKTWLEDENSLSEKLNLINKYNLAGVSGWSKGLEKKVIWNLISKID